MPERFFHIWQYEIASSAFYDTNGTKLEIFLLLHLAIFNFLLLYYTKIYLSNAFLKESIELCVKLRFAAVLWSGMVVLNE